MKNIVNYLWLIMPLVWFSSCKKDGDKLVATDLQGSVLTATSSDVVLTEDRGETLVLQLVWNQPDIGVNAGYHLADGSIQTTLQFSADQAFGSVQSESRITGAAASYTGAQLNTLARRMGLVAGEKANVYIRLKSGTGANMSPSYSNVLTVAITPYEPAENTAYLYMANTDLTTFDWKLCSRDHSGVYDGFVKVSQWHNFYLTSQANKDADVIYGGYPEDGKQYQLYAGTDRWNCWTSNGGYLYIRADVNNLTWSETVITALSVTGDFNGWSTTATPMTYDEANKVWTATVTTTEAEPWGMKILINGSWNFFFGGSDESEVCTLYTSDNGGFAYTATGTHKLILDLSDPKAFRYTIE